MPGLFDHAIADISSSFDSAVERSAFQGGTKRRLLLRSPNKDKENLATSTSDSASSCSGLPLAGLQLDRVSEIVLEGTHMALQCVSSVVDSKWQKQGAAIGVAQSRIAVLGNQNRTLHTQLSAVESA